MSFLVLYERKEGHLEKFTRFVSKDKAEAFMRTIMKNKNYHDDPSLYERLK